MSRYYLRIAVQGIIASAAIAGTIWVDNPYVKIVSGAIAAMAAYASAGAVLKPVEPFVGNVKDDAQVPPGQPTEP